jgi:hypothetical protein
MLSVENIEPFSSVQGLYINLSKIIKDQLSMIIDSDEIHNMSSDLNPDHIDCRLIMYSINKIEKLLNNVIITGSDNHLYICVNGISNSSGIEHERNTEDCKYFNRYKLLPGTIFMDKLDKEMMIWLKKNESQLPKETIYSSSRLPDDADFKIAKSIKKRPISGHVHVYGNLNELSLLFANINKSITLFDDNTFYSVKNIDKSGFLLQLLTTDNIFFPCFNNIVFDESKLELTDISGKIKMKRLSKIFKNIEDDTVQEYDYDMCCNYLEMVQYAMYYYDCKRVNASDYYKYIDVPSLSNLIECIKEMGNVESCFIQDDSLTLSIISNLISIIPDDRVKDKYNKRDYPIVDAKMMDIFSQYIGKELACSSLYDVVNSLGNINQEDNARIKCVKIINNASVSSTLSKISKLSYKNKSVSLDKKLC